MFLVGHFFYFIISLLALLLSISSVSSKFFRLVVPDSGYGFDLLIELFIAYRYRVCDRLSKEDDNSVSKICELLFRELCSAFVER